MGLLGVLWSSTTGSRWSNRACLVLRWCRSLPDPQNRTQALTGASLVFLSKTSLPLPLKGEELGFIQFGVVWVPNAEKPDAFPQEKTDASYPRASLAVAFGNCWPQLAHTASTGPVWGFAGVAPLLGPQKRTQGHTGASLVFACLLAHLRRITLPFGNPV